jgi:anti-sigma factor RsiW
MPCSTRRSPLRLRSLLVRFRPAIAAAAAALMVVGAGLDRLVVAPLGAALTTPAGNPDVSDDWRSAVAQYLALYTRDTLAEAGDGAGDSRQQLASLGKRLGLSLTPERVDLPDLPLKRADLYDYDDKPLAFLAYLDPRSGPVALCITTGGGSEARRVERRGDMNIVSWSQGPHSFMLIGRASSGTLQTLATTVASRFAQSG